MSTPRRFWGNSLLLIQLVILYSSPLANPSEIIDNEKDGNDISERPIEQYYFTNEVDFLAKQSMILGDYHDAAGRKTKEDVDDELITRLRFIEKSLQMELDYIRKLRAMKKDHDEKKKGETEHNSTQPCESGGTKSDKKDEEKEGDLDVPSIVSNTISGATWPTWAVPSEEVCLPRIQGPEVDHEYDYDWVVVHGFAWMHKALKCTEHAYDQKKPFYTPEMWRKLWKTFQDSTLFPFPIPQPEECTDRPYYVDYTTDGKGRGNFASRKILKGSLVNAGHPNTVFFLNANSWFRFVSSLSTMMACDVMEWVWLQDLTNAGNTVLCLNMDEAAFFNDGNWNSNINMAVKVKTSLDFYAIKDIEKGEEVLYDYGENEFDTSAMDL